MKLYLPLLTIIVFIGCSSSFKKEEKVLDYVIEEKIEKAKDLKKVVEKIVPKSKEESFMLKEIKEQLDFALTISNDYQRLYDDYKKLEKKHQSCNDYFYLMIIGWGLFLFMLILKFLKLKYVL